MARGWPVVPVARVLVALAAAVRRLQMDHSLCILWPACFVCVVSLRRRPAAPAPAPAPAGPDCSDAKFHKVGACRKPFLLSASGGCLADWSDLQVRCTWLVGTLVAASVGWLFGYLQRNWRAVL